MKKCIYCNSKVDDDSIFCTSCGKELPKQKKCTKCGKFIDDDCDWCTQCGAKQIEKTKPIEQPKPIEEPKVTKEIKTEQPVPPKKSKKKMLVAFLILGICVIGGAILFFAGNSIGKFGDEQSLEDSRIADSINMQLVADSIAAKEAYTNTNEASNNNNETNEEPTGTPCPEPRCGGEFVTNIVASASNTMPNQGSITYKASNLLDQDSNTIWATHFTGNEEKITFRLNGANGLYKISLVNGYNKSMESFENNSRAKDIKVYVNAILAAQETLSGDLYHWPEWITFNKEYDNVKLVSIVISSVYEGEKWNDLCISDINLFTKE